MDIKIITILESMCRNRSFLKKSIADLYDIEYYDMDKLLFELQGGSRV